MNPFRITLLVTIVFVLAVGVFAQSTPRTVVRSFYKFESANSQAFNRKNIDARKRWFTDRLYKLLINELTREKDFLARNPTDKPHFGDGLPFRRLDETCQLKGKSYRRQISYGQATVKGDRGNVDVYFKYPKACNISDVQYAVTMKNEKGRWVIDDIRYLPGSGSLVEDLKRSQY